jgi:23S rRNA G2445 N2-methylase RlmL
MNTIHVQLPNSIYKQVYELAKEEETSVDQFIAIALAEKISALKTVDYLQKRATRASREKFEKAMSKVPDVEPEDYDRL